MRFWKRRPAPPQQAETGLDMARLPRHVAIIMDGNGRWAQRKGLPRALGHRAGTQALRAIVRATSDYGIASLTLYAFSTENWSRSAEEVGALMTLLLESFTREIDELHANNVRIRILGDVEGLPKAQREAVAAAERRTEANTGLSLNFALNYGARAELARAAQRIARQVCEGAVALSDIDEQMVSGMLYTAGQPEVDLLIRTGAEMRMSNFLLYQCAYAELYFVDMLWPDFDVAAYQEALRAYQSRDRRFGGRKQ